MKKIALFCVVVLVSVTVVAGRKLDLKEITAGEFAVTRLNDVLPLSGGESYAQISDDGQRIVAYSFRTGKQTSVLFDAATARGPKVAHIDGYIISPDGKRMLIQTHTKRVYRHSSTATYYIYDTEQQA